MRDTPDAWLCRDRAFDRTGRALVLGVLNVTPDSFSDGGKFDRAGAASEHARRMTDEGADVIDIGGESSRPGAGPVAADEELRRVLPAVKAAVARGAAVSIDTTKASVAAACLDAGALIVNDITGLAGDPDMVRVVHDYRAGVIVMHMQGTPLNMQYDPQYTDVTAEVEAYLRRRVGELTDAGIDARRIMLDPGVGFGKTLEHNLQLLSEAERLLSLGRPLCWGVSRKSFIGKVTGRAVGDRLAGSLAALGHGLSVGAVHAVRAHDVGPTRDAVEIHAAVRRARKESAHE